jgi:hypothetical protein
MATTTPNYDINYDDERFTQVNTEKDAAISDMENTYQGMIDSSDQYYQNLQQNAQNWADKQTQLQNEQTDFTIEMIEQQKEQAQKDYVKEQSGAYQDWQKQSNQYGVNAEKMASQGMLGTGFSESSQVSMYNTYQNRVATSREVYQQAVLNYNNNIKEARLQNNAVLAEIAFEALQTQMELALEGFQYKNSLITEQMNKKIELDNIYYNRWQDVLTQMNTENAMKEDIRQYEQNFAENVRQFEEEKKIKLQELEQKKAEFEESIRQFNQSYELKVKEYNEGIRQFNEEIARLKAKDAKEYEIEIKKLEQQKATLAEQKRQFDEEAKLEAQKLEEQKRVNDAEIARIKAQTASYSSSGGSSGDSGGDSGGGSGTNDKGSSGGGSFSDSKVNMNSVLALGYGPLSAEKLAELVAQNKVRKYEKNGQIYFEKIIFPSGGQSNATPMKNLSAVRTTYSLK